MRHRSNAQLAFIVSLSAALPSCEEPTTPPPIIVKFSEVEGLKPNAPVWLRGVEVGRVERVSLGEGGYVDVEFRLSANAKKVEIARDDCASIEMRGLAGDKVLRLRAVGSSDEVLPAGAGECFGERPRGDASDQLSAILEQVLEGKGILGRLLTDKELANKFERSLECKP